MTKQAKKAKQDKQTAQVKRSKVRKAAAKKTSAVPEKDLPQLEASDTQTGHDTPALARIGQLEADRTNLMAQVAWARAVAQEQQKTLEVERARSEKLAADLEAQRQRIEQLKALTLLDRILGRHKRI